MVNHFTGVFLCGTSFYLKNAKENATEVGAVINLHLNLPEICAVVVGSLVCSSSLVLSF